MPPHSGVRPGSESGRQPPRLCREVAEKGVLTYVVPRAYGCAMQANEAMAVFSMKGQIVIPREVRREMGIEEGTRVTVSVENDAIVLRPITARYIKASFGRLKGRALLDTLAEDREKERDR